MASNRLLREGEAKRTVSVDALICFKGNAAAR